MEIFYCEKCDGKPYTGNLKYGIKCPVCGTILKSEEVNEDTLIHRSKITWKRKIININGKIPFFKQSDEKSINSFMISPGEKYYIYLGIKKIGRDSFRCRFILGNTPDRNGVITSTPIISSEFSFDSQIELSYLESGRKQMEDYIQAEGWEADESLFHVYYKLTNSKEDRKNVVLNDITRPYDEDKAADQYFIQYMQSDYGKIPVFSKTEDGFINSFKKIHSMNNDGYMQCMFFRAKNGDTLLGLSSFADSSALLFDDPYTSIIRYDRIMKEIKMPRI